jgi:prepilin-type N-terminal cleavage/methylation domain-containing protein
MMKIQRGFTLIELTLVLSLTAILLGFITINLARSRQSASLNAVEQVLLSDLKQQQLKAMIGDTEGRATSDSYGIHFDSNKYVLFHGTYSEGDSSNFVINLDSNMQFNNPEYNVAFSRLSGEITAATTIELQDKNDSKLVRIHLNTLGTATQIELP